MHAKTQNAAIVRYPYTLADFAEEYPQTSPPADFARAALPDAEIVVVVVTAAPTASGKTAKESTPIYNPDRQRWEQSWTLHDQVAPAGTTNITLSGPIA
jgi:hypothetical protein